MNILSLQDKTLLVTGANGYVGRNLVAYLLARGHRVIAATRSAAHAARFTGPRCEHRVLDLNAADHLRQQLRDVDVIFHAAADLRNWGRTSVAENFNVGGTQKLLAAAQGQASRFVLVSTEAVLLGTQPMTGMTECTPYPARPIGVYASSKQATEKLVLQASKPGFACVSVRPRMVWGRDDTTILPKLKKAIASGRFLWIAHGQYLTSTTHVDNLCEALYLAALHGRGGQAYFVTDGAPVVFRDFVTFQLRDYPGKIPNASLPRAVTLAIAAIVEALWRVLRLESTPPIMRAQVRLTGSPVTIDDTLARQELGYAGLTFEQLVRREST